MSDIATIWDPASGTGDWVIDPPLSMIWVDESGNSIVDERGRAVDVFFKPGTGLVTGADLYTAALISIFTDAAAGDDDIIPDGSSNPRGWWAGSIGSKLWLRSRLKAVPATLALVKHDIETALAWFVDDGVVDAVDVTTEFTSPGVIGAEAIFRRSDGAHAALRFSRLFEVI